MMSPKKLADKATELKRRAALADNPQVRDALLKSAEEYTQKAKTASGDALVK